MEKANYIPSSGNILAKAQLSVEILYIGFCRVSDWTKKTL